MTRYDIDVRIRMSTPLLIASGSPRWGADLATALDEYGYPFIPGTSLRGRLRHITHAVARTLGLFACDEPALDRMCAAPNAGEDLSGRLLLPVQNGKALGRFCPVCRLFGSPHGLPSRVSVTDLRLTQAGDLRKVPAHTFTRVRNHVAINRKRRVAEGGKLFAVEATSPGLEAISYEGSIWVSLPDDDAALMGLLVAALAQLYAVGGHNSRGYGWAEGPGVALGSEAGEKTACFSCASYSWEQARADLHTLLQSAGGEA